MVILGHSVKSVSADKNTAKIDKKVDKIDINSTVKIKSVKERKMNITGVDSEKNSILGVDFEFMIKYSPDIGNININGEVIYKGTVNKKILDSWKKDKKLPIDVDIEIKNFLLRKCLLCAIHISEEMQLPPPISVPRIRKKNEQPNYIG